jgi:hypothetical protein
MMYMAFIRIERRFFLTYAVYKDPHQVKTRNDQRRKCQYRRIGKGCVPDGFSDDFYTEDTQNDPYGQATGIAHEYFPSLVVVPENIRIKKRNQDAQRGESQHGIKPLVQVDVDQSVKE